MLRKLTVITIVCWMISSVLLAQDRPAPREGMELIASYRQGIPVEIRIDAEARERQEIKGRIQQLLNEAQEAEERAAQLRAEAQELKRAISGQPKDRPGDNRDKGINIEAMHEKMMKMKEEFERARMDGRREEARELQKNIERLAGEIKNIQIRQTKMQLEQLERQANEAEMGGNGERAEKLWGRIEKIKGVLLRDRGGQEGNELMEQMHRELGELRAEAERAELDGRFNEARELGKQAEMLEREVGERERQMDRRRAEQGERRIASLELKASEAERQSQSEQARKLWARVEQVGQAMHLDKRREEVVDLVERIHPLVEELKRSCAEAMERGDHDKAAQLQEMVEKVVDMIAGQLDEQRGVECDEPRGEFRESEKPRVMLERPRQIDVMLHFAPQGEKERRGAETFEEQIDRKLRAAEKSELAGHPDRAMELRREAEQLERSRGDFWAITEATDFDKQIEKLHVLAEEAENRGDKEEAKILRQEIENLQQVPSEVRPEPRRVIDRQQPPLEREVDTLRQEVRQLREDMNWLKEALKKKIDL